MNRPIQLQLELVYDTINLSRRIISNSTQKHIDGENSLILSNLIAIDQCPTMIIIQLSTGISRVKLIDQTGFCNQNSGCVEMFDKI